MSTSMSISRAWPCGYGPFGLWGQGDRVWGVLDQPPDLAVGVAVGGVAVGDARSSGTSAPVGHAPAAGSNAQRIRVWSRPVELTLGTTEITCWRTALSLKWDNVLVGADGIEPPTARV